MPPFRRNCKICDKRKAFLKGYAVGVMGGELNFCNVCREELSRENEQLNTSHVAFPITLIEYLVINKITL